MTGFYQAARSVFLGGALLLSAASQAAPGFIDPLDEYASISPLAERGLINGLAAAGGRLVAVGQRGHILYSDDLGGHWIQARVPVSVDLTAVTFVDGKQGWAVGHDSVVLTTRDGGANWIRQLDGRADSSAPPRPLLDVWFSDAAHGMAVGAFGLAVCTADGGANWRHCETEIDNPNGLHLNAIRSIGGAVYIAGEQGLLLKADASGKFTPLASPYKGSFFGITGDANTLLGFGLRGNAYASDDGGATWRQSNTGVATGLTAGTVLADGTLVLVSQAGQVLKSRDRGASFQAQPLVKPMSTAAVLAMPSNALLVGGVRGLQVQPAAK